jgi:hypothetical protein
MTGQLIRRLSRATIIAVAIVIGCDKDWRDNVYSSKNCEDATEQMKVSLNTVCAEAQFRDTPFCSCCIPSGFYSIDDTCACKPLILDVEFCFYSESSGGKPAVRRALEYAASVCVNRTVNVSPWNSDASVACAVSTADGGSSDASGDHDSADQ